MNLYEYVKSNPVNYTDPLGLAIYAFDGTNNDKDADPKGKRTNIARFYDAYEKGYNGSGRNFYVSGVGTRNREELTGNVSGAGGEQRLREAYARLQQNFCDGDTEIVIIGFSRGAALARAFANMINSRGNPASLELNYSRDGKMPAGYCECVQGDVKVKFMGLFDTVGSFGIPGNQTDIGKDFAIPSNVQRTAHAVSQHERRKNFELASSLPYAGYIDPSGRIIERSFPGVHADIGGGYADSNWRARYSLSWMAWQASFAGVSFGDSKNWDLSGFTWPPTGTGVHNSNCLGWFLPLRQHPIMTPKQVHEVEKEERTIFYYGKPKKKLRK